jgi:geranylgeranyl diphosphate synthase type I
MNPFDAFSRAWLPRLESEMRALLEGEPAELRGMYGMMRYHLGWEDRHGQPDDAPKGKRLRPLLTLLTAQAAGGNPTQALPAAAAVELIHNFSLIHDDIEDRSPTRRHRPTLWSWVGEPQAINAGDAMFVLAHLAMLRLRQQHLPAPRILDAMQILDDTCLHLTQGQFLDMDFETRTDVTLAEYMTMIEGKTAALIAAAAELGAVVAGSDRAAAYRHFGRELGISFQIEDDILGIWGEEALTGKSTTGDILTRKKTLPVLYALAQSSPAAAQLRAYYTREAPLTPDDLPAILSLLDELGARPYAEAQGRAHAEAALAALAETDGDPESIAMLEGLVHTLVGRRW